ncbi:MAG: SMP-30/gluconolactonase/LRE family protein [Chloroflexi bacterium]|nr:MAG: SMP-30/gluconolactonase/LRE family protein [Chloroflexota bacterium]
MRISRSLWTLSAALMSVALLFAGGGVASASTSWTIAPVVGGLNSPRGVAFDGQGSMYVAEAGQFFPIDVGPFGVSRTGKVDKFTFGGGAANSVWSTAFDSLYDSAHGAPEVLGPAGVSAIGNGCMKDSQGQRNGCQVLVIISESRDGVNATTPGLTFSQIGHLYRLDGASGTPTDKSDVGDQQYAWSAQHASLWQEFPDSNPYDVLVTKDPTTDTIRTFVIDAGANTVSEVMPNGTNHIIAFIPNDPIRDSTPTCVAQGPDGALYIGTLDLAANFAFGPGQSHVYRVDPNTTESYLTAAHVWASGLTTTTACTFDRAGNFWATDMFQPNPNGPPGDLVRIPFNNPSALVHIGGGALPFPGGIAQGPDGSMYVTVYSAITAPGIGAVVKVTTNG